MKSTREMTAEELSAESRKLSEELRDLSSRRDKVDAEYSRKMAQAKARKEIGKLSPETVEFLCEQHEADKQTEKPQADGVATAPRAQIRGTGTYKSSKR